MWVLRPVVLSSGAGLSRVAVPIALLFFVLIQPALAATSVITDWTNPSSGDWDIAANWSAGLPNANQFEVRIVNTNSKAVAIQPTTPVNFPGAMTVQNLRVGGVPPSTNLLLLNFSGTTTPLRVLNDFNIETNGRVLMLHSGLNVSNVLNVNGVFDQEGGQLTFTNWAANRMQIEGGRFNLTNGYVKGKSLYLGGTNAGYVNASGLVHVDWLGLGFKPAFPNNSSATYVLHSGWLIVDVHESVGENGFGTLTQNGGTNSSPDISVGNGTYVKTAGGLFAGELRVLGTSEPTLVPPAGVMTHAGGTAIISNVLRLVGQANQRIATFNMLGGSLAAPRVQLEVAARFTQSNGLVNVAQELFIDDGRGIPSSYALSGGNLFVGNAIVSSSSSTGFDQSGGTHRVTNNLWIANESIYRLSGGTLSVSNIILSGNLGQPPQIFVLAAPPFAITNQSISSHGGAVVIQDSTQEFGRLTMQGDSGINLAGTSAILRFADSHTNSWESQLFGVVPRLAVFNWNGSTNGGGTDRLIFGTNNSALTASQVSQIRFVNPGAFSPGTYPARILSTGEVVPMPLPVLSLQNNVTNLVISWPGNFILQSATNVVGPYFDLSNATNPYTLDVKQFPMQFFRLRD
jgi:hypothetical protein